MTGENKERPRMQWVATHDMDIPTVTSAKELEDNLTQLVESKILGFIVRRRVAFEEIKAISNSAVAKRIIDGLRMIGHLFEEDVQIPAIRRKESKERGSLQVKNNSSERTVNEIVVHSTIAGAGQVLLGESGPQAMTALAKENLKPMLCEVLGRKLLECVELVDPRIIRPAIYTERLHRGDHIVYALGNAKGPVWRRFDTSDAPREETAVVLTRQGYIPTEC